MLAGSLWMVQNPGWLIQVFQNLHDEMQRRPSPWQRHFVLTQSLPDNRRIRMAIRLTGALLAALAAAHLYQEALWMLAHYGQ
jgi:hypothetical protein